PQDGRIHINADGREADVRVSSMPTVVGEKIVMRLLDRSRLVVDINEIGIEGEQLLQMKSLLHRPNGILLVTGPTGSGKTTTLYASLAHLRSVETNIVTIEDPVEYQIERITQIQVNEEQGLSFAKTLRSVLRQDPDVIMIGEIRDRDTAEVAVQAALTGHLVLATLHTNESAGALVRLIEMGIEPYLLTSAITGVIAQRLVRLVCTHCKTVYFPPRELLNRIGWKGRNSSFVTGQGCEHCFDSGLRNRAGVFEIMVMDSSLRQLILQNPSADAIRHHNVQRGMLTLRDQAFRLVEDGKTSLDAVMRVLFLGETTEDIETVREAQNV
ncbi:type II/IV secretion system protein, partial [bacterium]|nr:type II/IV secretion system protein [bacterium]